MVKTSLENKENKQTTSRTTNTRVRSPFSDGKIKDISIAPNKENRDKNNLSCMRSPDRSKPILSIIYQNVRGLRTKTKEFYQASVDQECEVIAITETSLTAGINDAGLFDSSQYSVFCQDRVLSLANKFRG